MKLSFLFGAGAEIGYGLPSGGKFALDIFRQNPISVKDEFKKMRDEIDSETTYAGTWLPKDYCEKNVSSFGKSVFEIIIKDTIEHNKEQIIQRLNNFDEIAKFECEKIKERNVKHFIEETIKQKISDCNMINRVSFIDYLEKGNKIFSSNWFSALMQLYKNKDNLDDLARYELQKMLISILELQAGALSADFAKHFNDGLFKKKDDKIEFLDDIGDVFKLNYKSAGLSGLEYIMENKTIQVTDDQSAVALFAHNIVENIYSTVLDYKTLIDSNWHYLYCPRDEWAKFCKINIFLYTVKNYIEKQLHDNYDSSKRGYYNDVFEIKDDVEILAIATTNYNTLIDEIINKEIYHLNGATNMYYDPYLNRIGEKSTLNEHKKHFLVPLIFTQSGTKPMTSIDMSLKYVEVYQKYKASDYIIIVGFGFNPDDEHINGILRTLIDVDHKKIIVIDVDDKIDSYKIAKKLKVSNEENIEIMYVDASRERNGVKWISEIIARKIDE